MAKPISEWTTEDLQALLGSEETSNLEFKDGRSLLNETGKKADIAKDVSAMANAAGGLIVYGIHERDSVADSIAGCPAEHGKAEWFEQVINNNIEPKVQGVTIKRIDLPDDKMALVVNVPKATTFAPHQNKTDGRYYRRYNTTSQVMLDHEVRDLMNRGSSPELYLRYAMIPTDIPDQYRLSVSAGNRSTEPALYTRIDLIFEASIVPEDADGEWATHTIDFGEHPGSVLRSRQFLTPAHMPIIKEHEQMIFSGKVMVDANTAHEMAYRISCPGYHHTESFYIWRQHGKVVMFDPPRLAKPDWL